MLTVSLLQRIWLGDVMLIVTNPISHWIKNSCIKDSKYVLVVTFKFTASLNRFPDLDSTSTEYGVPGCKSMKEWSVPSIVSIVTILAPWVNVSLYLSTWPLGALHWTEIWLLLTKDWVRFSGLFGTEKEKLLTEAFTHKYLCFIKSMIDNLMHLLM